MYIATIPNRQSPPAILLRETYRDKGKVKNRTLANLSRWEPARIEALRRALRGEYDLPSPTEPVCGVSVGMLFALKEIAKDLGLSQALGNRRMGKLGLFQVLSRVGGARSRLEMVRWAKDHAVEEILGLNTFDEEDLYESLMDLSVRQSVIEAALYHQYVKRKGKVPLLFLYDVTSSYVEGEKNALAAFGYNRDKKNGKLQLVFGLLTDDEGEPLAIRVFKGNTSDPQTVSDQIEILQKQFHLNEVVFVGDKGMVKSSGKEKLSEAGMRYITALTDPEIRRLLKEGVLQLTFFDENVCEVEADGLRYIVRKNDSEARKAFHRVEDKLKKLHEKVEARNKKVLESSRCHREVGKKRVQEWIKRYRLEALVSLEQKGKELVMAVDEQAKQKALELAGCYCIVTDVPKDVLDAEAVHARYKDLGKVERDFRLLKTAFLEVRPVFVRLEEHTKGHVFSCMLSLKVLREMEKRLTAAFGTTDTNPHGVTVENALAALGRLCFLTYQAEGIPAITRLPKPDEHQGHILKALQVDLPKTLTA